MTTPCTGFALCRLLRIAEPLGSAEYVEFEEAQDKTVPGPRSPLCLWSYFEGRAIDQVGDDLPLISTGLCGKPLLPQNSGLIRLATPRKIGQDQLRGQFLAGNPAVRIRVPGQCDPCRGASAAGRRVNACSAGTKWCQCRFTTAMVSS